MIMLWPTLFVFLLSATAVFAQVPPPTLEIETTSDTPVYEIVSVKPDEQGDSSRPVTYRYTPDGLIAKNMTLRLLIRNAYGLSDFQIVGGPKWVETELWAIEARMDKAQTEALQKLNADEAKSERQHMLQNLLAERFELSVHREKREGQVFALIVAKGGPKFGETKGEVTNPGGTANGKLTLRGAPVASLARLLSQVLDRTVVDSTGLTAKYDLTLQWTPDLFELAASDASPPESTGASIFTVLQEQLGLKLESTKGPVDVLVVDHVERPSEN